MRKEDRFNGQPGLVLSAGPEGWWDSERVSCPAVIREADGTWKMWYYGRDASFDRMVNLPTGRIGLAVSRDGIRWERVRGPMTMGAVMDPADAVTDRFDNAHVGVCCVYQEQDLYWMWYFGGDQSTTRSPSLKGVISTVKGSSMRIGGAISRDGKNWVRLEGPHRGALLDAQDARDPQMAAWPRVLKDDDGTYKMYYKGNGVSLAVSTDGLRWEKKGPVGLLPGQPGSFDDAMVGNCHVIKVNGQYLMFYEAMDHEIYFCIGLAVSDDGIHWRKDDRGEQPGGPVFRHSPKGSGRFDAQAVGTPCIVPLPDGGFHMYYVGCPEMGHDELSAMHLIGMAVSDGPDFRKWHRPGE